MKKILFILLSIQILFAVEVKELNMEDTVKNSIQKRGKHFYKVTVPKNKSLTVTLLKSNANIKLYMKAKKVSIKRMECSSSNSNRRDDKCLIKNTTNKKLVYYILVYGFKKGSYLLSLSTGDIEELIPSSDSFLKKVLIKEENPERGVSVKYDKEKKIAYVFVDQESDFFDKHKGLTSIDYSDENNLMIINYNPTIYFEISNIYLTTNGILTFTYTDTHQYLATINLNTLEFVERIMITMEGLNSWAEYKRAGSNIDLFYTIHSTPEQGLYKYYHISESGDITQIQGIHAGGLDSYFLWEQGVMANNEYYITYLQSYVSGGTRYLKYIKKIYNISDLPNMPLIDTIITDEEESI